MKSGAGAGLGGPRARGGAASTRSTGSAAKSITGRTASTTGAGIAGNSALDVSVRRSADADSVRESQHVPCEALGPEGVSSSLAWSPQQHFAVTCPRMWQKNACALTEPAGNSSIKAMARAKMRRNLQLR